MSSVREALGGLTAEQHDLLRSKVVRGERPPLEWLRVLAPLHALDAHVDAALARSGRQVAWACGALVVALPLLIVAASAAFAPLAVVAVLIAVGGVVGLLALRVRRARLRRVDLAGEPLRLLVALLPILAEDAAPGGPLRLALDLRGHRDDAKALGAGEPYRRDPYLRIVDAYFADPYLEARLGFADGAAVAISGRVQSRVTTRTKRSASGKIKQKTKHKSRTTYEVVVDFPARNYAAAPAPSGVAPGTDRERVQARAGRTTVRERRVLKAIGSTVALDAAHVVDLLAHAYDRVDPSRRKKLR